MKSSYILFLVLINRSIIELQEFQLFFFVMRLIEIIFYYHCTNRKGKISATVVTPEGPQEREEVFYTIPLHGRRRHSVGGYLTTGVAGSGEVTAVPSEVPRMPPPKFSQKEDEAVKRRRPKNFPFKGKCCLLYGL